MRILLRSVVAAGPGHVYALGSSGIQWRSSQLRVMLEACRRGRNGAIRRSSKEALGGETRSEMLCSGRPQLRGPHVDKQQAQRGEMHTYHLLIALSPHQRLCFVFLHCVSQSYFASALDTKSHQHHVYRSLRKDCDIQL
jgi:hypothetical protein